MTSQTATIDVLAEPLAGILRAAARQAGADSDEGISTAWLIARRAAVTGRGPGWVITATRRILARQAIPVGTICIDDDDPDGRALAEVLAAPEKPEIETWRLADLPAEVEELIKGGTAGLAAKRRVTQRRAQQIVAAAAEHAAQGDLFGFGAVAPTGGV